MRDTINLMRYGQMLKRLYGNMLKEVMNQYGLTRNEVDVLLFLANNPSYDTEKDIVELRSLSKSHVCKSVDSLVKRGYLEAIQDVKDRRCMHLRLLPAAGPVAEEAKEVQKALIERMYRNVSSEEKEVLSHISQKILENLKEALNNDR